ncbi:hypothetical protein F4778DRAFT_25888 [Xylariomycetidae sp. FL2044]|nr:hypothetical protein F4778DRAFT_25888 [Xylariomycetidae sp. FL2044]
MASLRSPPNFRSKRNEVLQPKKLGDPYEASKDGFPPITQLARRESRIAQSESSSSSRSRTPQSRIPQNPSSRKEASSKISARPPLTHQTQSWSKSSATGPPSTSSSNVQQVHDAPKQPRKVLRRKQYGVSPEPVDLRVQTRTDSGRTSSSSSIPRSHSSFDPHTQYLDRSITDSPVEIRIAHQVEMPKANMTEHPRIYPELDRYRDIRLPSSSDESPKDLPYKLTTENLPPPTPLFSGTSSHSQLSTSSASPSTRFSESPGPGPYSRDTTPTSMSSQSPGIVAPMRLPVARVRQASPAETRPPVTRRRAGSTSNEGEEFSAGLASVREALTSSSSNSTVRTEEQKENKKRPGLSPAAPNPPPRKSSQKFKKDRGQGDLYSPSKPSRVPAQPVMRSPSPNRATTQAREGARPVTSPQPRPTPPSRPSRDGTPDLYSQFGGPVPVIHSNLSSTTLSDRRQSGQLLPSSLPRSTTPSSNQDRSASSRGQISREPTPAPRPGLSADTKPGKQEASRVTRTPSPVVSSFKTRFPIFGRRTKTAPEVSQVQKKEKPARKGPAAGTGHEGYGRVGAVKRRSSNAANLPRGLVGPSSSAESLSSLQPTDSFLLDRMNPVVIAGGEVVENRNTSSEFARTDSSHSISSSHPVLRPRKNSSVSSSSREEDRQTLWPSAYPRASTRSRRPSDSSDSEAVTMKSTLAFRRSVQRLRSPDQAPLNIPRPIVTRHYRSPSTDSVGTTILTDDSLQDALLELPPKPPAENAQVKTAPRKLTKPAKSPRRWNLFGRSQNQSPAAAKKQVEASVSVAAKPPQDKPVAFYTMMDSSEQEDTEDLDVNAILRAAEVVHTSQNMAPEREGEPSGDERAAPHLPHLPPSEQQATAREPGNISIVSDTTRVRRQSTNEQVGVGKVAPVNLAGRPSRLPQVGRIPRVINTRPEHTSPKSFSRPFHRVSLQLPPSQTGPVDCESLAKGPSPEGSSTSELVNAEPAENTNARNFLREAQNEPSPKLGHSGREFLTFSPRENSSCTGSTESSGPAMVGYSNHTAVLPESSAPLGEDEVWDEYNDLLGDAPPSATSSHGVPFHLEGYETKLAEKSAKPLLSPTINGEAAKSIRDSIETGKAATSSSHYSADMTARINAAFKFGPDPPATPFSVSEFVSGYGDRNNSDTKASEPAPRNSSSSTASAKGKPASARNSNSSQNSEETPLSQVNLRVGSMTVSKWLTFGHVLFSPVREDLVNAVGSLKRHSILVIDGLGNDDWSFYAAETYPAATFFNLSPRAPLPAEHQSASSFPLSPPNHHQIQFMSNAGKFPFGTDSFACVVFRFPSAAPESHYRNIISEARRVLKPGGYIEFSILDVDLNNMGSRTRRSVRRLKERVNTKNPDISLGSTADLVLRLLGKKGFVDIKNCRVGVPVASAITNATKKKGGKKDERSLAEMMRDDTETGDENITKMVSKVGRWWYNRCYEAATGMNSSIWHDRNLLAECEEWGTSLKLMVCHAKTADGGRVASI